MKKRHQQKLVVLGLILFLIWNVPFVTIFDVDFQILGFPAFYVFIFVSWLVSIIITYTVLKKFHE